MFIQLGCAYIALVCCRNYACTPEHSRTTSLHQRRKCTLHQILEEARFVSVQTWILLPHYFYIHVKYHSGPKITTFSSEVLTVLVIFGCSSLGLLMHPKKASPQPPLTLILPVGKQHYSDVQTLSLTRWPKNSTLNCFTAVCVKISGFVASIDSNGIIKERIL